METIIEQILIHIATLNDEVGGIQAIVGNMQVNIAVLQAQVSQILWLQRAVLVVILGFVFSRILLRVFNNKNAERK